MVKAINKSGTFPDKRKYLPASARSKLRELAHQMRHEGKDKDGHTYIYLTDLTAISGDSFHLDTHNRKAILKINYPPMEIELSTHKGSISSVKRSWFSYILLKNPIKVASNAIEYFSKHYNTLSVNKTFLERKLAVSEQF